MIQSYDIQTFLKLAETNPVLDVRSPAEFEYGRIPIATNLPLFDNEERSEIGTLYKREGKAEAIKRGLELVGPKMRSMVEQVETLRYQDHLLVHCWRGGMRSASVAWLLNTYGLSAATLLGGYKSFRNHLLEYFECPLELKIITGPTGSGKTDLLKALERKGEQVIDLEGLAQHKGSVFGELGQNAQPSSEHFQNLIFWRLRSFDLSRPVWVEDESIGIGRVMIPEPFWKQMCKAPRIFFNMNKDVRIRRLVTEYGSFPTETLSAKILQLHKKLGGQHLKKAMDDLAAGDLQSVANILLVYYDKAYNNSVERHAGKIFHRIDASHEDYDFWAAAISGQIGTTYDRTNKTHSV